MEDEILRSNITTKKSSPIREARQTYFALKTDKMQKNLINDKLGDDRLGARPEGDMKDKTKASNVGMMNKDETSSACHNHEQMESDDSTSFDENVTKIREDKRENEQISLLSCRI